MLGVTEIVQVKQVHGGRAVLASQARGAEADAIVADAKGVAVGVRVADCVPVLVADEASGRAAAIHAGWRGIVGNVVEAGLELLGAWSAPRRRRVVVAIGPSIGPCCFEVGLDVADLIAASCAGWNGEPIVVETRKDKAFVDLRRAVRAQLRSLDVPDDRIDDVPGCTKHEPARFHSFRRDGANSGRMLCAIASKIDP